MAGPELSRDIMMSGLGTTATSGITSGKIMDMDGFENFLAIGILSATNASAGLYISVGDTTAAMGPATGFVPGTQKTLYLDVRRPGKRYVQANIRATTTTGAWRAVLGIPYNARALPTTQLASTTGLRRYTPTTGAATA